MKRHIKVSPWITYFEGLTEGATVVAKYKKSKFCKIIMNAIQFSTMCTIIDAFSGINSKVVIKCAQ